jgi:hypothetical protein
VKLSSVSTLSVLMSFLACGQSTLEVSGTYQTVTESESVTQLLLKPDGRARVVLRLWEPGSAAAVAVDTVLREATWSRNGRSITVHYASGSEELEYFESLSFEGFGCSGDGAALKEVGRTPGEGLLRGATLWSEEALRTVPDPC